MFLHVLFVCVADKVDVLSNFAITFFFRRVKWLLLFKLVESGRVHRSFELWTERCFGFTHVTPINTPEKVMPHNLLDPVFAQPVVHVAHQPLQQIGGLGRQLRLRWNRQGLPPVQDFLAGHRGVVREKRRVPYHHLVQNRTDTPPVGRLIVTFPREDFWRDVVRGAYRRVGQFSVSFVLVALVCDGAAEVFVAHTVGISLVRSDFVLQLFRHLFDLYMFAKAKITQFDMAVRANQQIVWF